MSYIPSPLPWKIVEEKQGNKIGSAKVIDAKGQEIMGADEPDDETMGNFLRIVAAVNATAALPLPYLKAENITSVLKSIKTIADTFDATGHAQIKPRVVQRIKKIADGIPSV